MKLALLPSTRIRHRRDLYSGGLLAAPAAAATANRASSAATIRSRRSASPTIPLQALLPAGAIGPGVPALTIVTEGVFAGTRARLLPVAPLWLALILIEIVSASLVLVRPRAVLLIEVGLVPGRPLLSQISLILVSELRLIVLLIEMRRSAVEIVGPVVVDILAVDVVGVQVVAVYIVGVDVVPVDVVRVDVIPAVVIVAVREGIGVGNVGVVVVDHRGIVPAASP